MRALLVQLYDKLIGYPIFEHLPVAPRHGRYHSPTMGQLSAVKSPANFLL